MPLTRTGLLAGNSISTRTRELFSHSTASTCHITTASTPASFSRHPGTVTYYTAPPPSAATRTPPLTPRCCVRTGRGYTLDSTAPPHSPGFSRVMEFRTRTRITHAVERSVDVRLWFNPIRRRGRFGYRRDFLVARILATYHRPRPRHRVWPADRAVGVVLCDVWCHPLFPTPTFYHPHRA